MIEYEGVSKVYNSDVVAVDNVDLEIRDGEFVCFIGASGSGKTTSLRLINRMNDVTKGKITINGENIAEMNPVDLRRKIGYAIQQTGLLPHLTVYENIVTVPRLLNWSDQKCRETAERLMDRVELPLEMLERYPSELSDGQQQRIGVIRALAANPSVVLMDEPSLSMLSILMLAVGLGSNLVVITVFIYSVLPILRNTYAGVRSVDANILDVGKGMGMTKWQMIYKIELPLSMSVIMGGIRNAFIMGIGVATLGTFVGASGLGDILQQGVNATEGTSIILAGVLPISIMAIIGDVFLTWVENKLDPSTR